MQSAVLAIANPSVCLSVCLSICHTLALCQNNWLSTTAIFGNLGGYIFENFRDTASNIIWWYATHCRPVLIAKWMTLSGYFMSKSVFGQHFLNQSIWMSKN